MGRAFLMEDRMDIFWLMVSMREEWTISRCERNGGGGGVGTDEERCPPARLPAELSSSSWERERTRLPPLPPSGPPVDEDGGRCRLWCCCCW